jgi:secondary thiamine-phosphate synthase enzyme
MLQSSTRLGIATRGPGLYEFTSELNRFVAGAGVREGLVTAFCRHTSASLLIQENADPDVRTDLLTYFEEIAPEDTARYVHGAEGRDDMPAHLRTALTHVHLAVPVDAGRLVLGTWQGIFLFEHRRAPHRREIVLHLLGD